MIKRRSKKIAVLPQQRILEYQLQFPSLTVYLILCLSNTKNIFSQFCLVLHKAKRWVGVESHINFPKVLQA